ncbi:hypothetical protein SUDANB95_07882 (plasmid) [Actinosynnema sp. ALI-1.44]
MSEPYGNPMLDELLAAAGLDTAAATAKARSWSKVLPHLTVAWHNYTGRGLARIVAESPTPWPGVMRPRHQIRSRTMTSPFDLGDIACASIEALADLIDTDAHRNAYFDGRPVPDVPVHVRFDTEPADPNVPISSRTGDNGTVLDGAVALLRIAVPQFVDAQWWPDQIEQGGQEDCTSFDYPEQFAAIRAVASTWNQT